MADIGDILDVFDFKTVELQSAFKQVFSDVSAQVADMGIVVDSQATSVHSDIRLLNRDKRFFGPGEGVEDSQHFPLRNQPGFYYLRLDFNQKSYKSLED
jgi:hypothetical protein